MVALVQAAIVKRNPSLKIALWSWLDFLLSPQPSHIVLLKICSFLRHCPLIPPQQHQPSLLYSPNAFTPWWHSDESLLTVSILAFCWSWNVHKVRSQNYVAVQIPRNWFFTTVICHLIGVTYHVFFVDVCWVLTWFLPINTLLLLINQCLMWRICHHFLHLT